MQREVAGQQVEVDRVNRVTVIEVALKPPPVALSEIGGQQVEVDRIDSSIHIGVAEIGVANKQARVIAGLPEKGRGISDERILGDAQGGIVQRSRSDSG